MPAVRFETCAGWIGNRHAEIATTIQRTMVEAIKIPEDDRDIRITEHAAHAFYPPPGRGPNYSILEISLLNGRSLDAKRRLYAGLSAAMAAFGLGENDLKVVLIEVPRDNWGLRGKASTDIELGFKVDV
jgi:phenylpyruvate tautomerase PptA (4-oxalocrotonate tautomerase family)